MLRKATTAIVPAKRAETIALHSSGVIMFGAGEPFGNGDSYRGRKARSVWAAITHLSASERDAIGRAVFDLSPRDASSIMGESIAYAVEKVGRVTVEQSRRGVERWQVWIDRAGEHRLTVYPGEK